MGAFEYTLIGMVFLGVLITIVAIQYDKYTKKS